MPTRLTTITATAAALLFTTIYLVCITYDTSTTLSTTTTTTKSNMSSNPANAPIPIKITLTAPPPIPSTTTTTTDKPARLRLHLTLQNTSQSPLHILTWSTPLDARASARGIYRLTSSRTSQAVQCIDVKYKRRMPPSGYFSLEDNADVIVAIAPGGKVEREVEIGVPELKVESGERYKVHVQGSWLGVWSGEGRSRFGFGEGDGAMVGDFVSGEVELLVSGGESTR